MKKYIIVIQAVLLISIGVSGNAFAQHEHHKPKQETKPASKPSLAPAKKAPVPRKSAPHKPVEKPATKKAVAKPEKLQSPVIIPPQVVPDTSHKMQHNQHQQHTMPGTDTASTKMQYDVHAGDSTGHGAHSGHTDNMSHAFSLHLPMTRNGSGTGWLPDASPMYGYMIHRPKWMYMVHGNLFFRYNNQDISNKGRRGDSQIDAPSWLMVMGQRRVGTKGLFHFNTMFSADALITGGAGYPLLFQSGETHNGKPLVDRQHPHDLFSEASISYAHSFTEKADAFIYLGYPGEPALGPVAFMHRPAALYNPDAPLSHHWIDATHITFGVATLGVRLGKFKLEGSSFTGREPDEKRFDFDKPRFDSRSARLTFNPSENWALQVSQGYLKSPEVIHADENVSKTTASATYSKQLTGENWLNATTVWGMNKAAGQHAEHVFLLEASLRIRKAALYTRYEFVQKSAEELALNEDEFDHHLLLPVNALTAGLSYDLAEFSRLRLAAGGQMSVYKADERLNTLYGKYPLAAEVYLRLYPSLMQMR